MRTVNKIFFFFCTLLMFSVAVNAQSFEGKVKFKISDGSSSNEMDYLAKGNKFRVNVTEEGMNVGMIMDMSAKKMLMLIPQSNMYMELPFNDDTISDDYDSPEGEIVNTGETKTILGYECQKWVHTTSEGRTELWLAKELGGFMFFENPMEQTEKSGWQSFVEAGKMFPIMVEEKNNAGRVVSRMEVTSIEPMSLDDSLFRVPSGYNKMDIPMMNMDNFK